jgi:hypothetical protein
MYGAPTTVSKPDALTAAAVGGLLALTTTTQLPAAAEAESTMTTLPVDTMLQDEAAAEQTVAVQVWDPKMKLLPDSVTVPPAYAAAGIAAVIVGDATIFIFKFWFSIEKCLGLLNNTFKLHKPESAFIATNTIWDSDTMEQLCDADEHIVMAQTWFSWTNGPPVMVTTLPK